MKLRNLMYASMIACAFASCSKDEVIDGPENGGDANATLEVKVVNAETKAFISPDKTIKSLKLVVFNGTDDASPVEVIGTVAGKNGAGTSVRTDLKPGNKRVIILANVADGLVNVGDTYTTVLGKTQTFESENATNGFSMNSKVYTITVAGSKITYLGYDADVADVNNVYLEANKPIKLYRNVAKIILTSVRVKEGLGSAVTSQYPGARVEITEAFLLHAHKTTKLVGKDATEWGSINMEGTNGYLNGVLNSAYTPWVTYMKTPNANNKLPLAVYPFIENTTAFPYGQALSGTDVVNTISFEKVASITTPQTPFYAYENTEAEAGYRTLLVVKADFFYKNVDGIEVKEADRYYPLSVGYYGDVKFDDPTIETQFQALRSGVKLEGVLRNLQYNVSITITGPGYKTPFGPKPDGGGDQPGQEGDTFLDAMIKVVEFGVVNQGGEIE